MLCLSFTDLSIYSPPRALALMLSFSQVVSFTFPRIVNEVGVCFHVFICLFSGFAFPFFKIFSAFSLVFCRLFLSLLIQTRAESMNQGISYFCERQKHLVPASRVISGYPTPYLNNLQTSLCPQVIHLSGPQVLPPSLTVHSWSVWSTVCFYVWYNQFNYFIFWSV